MGFAYRGAGVGALLLGAALVAPAFAADANHGKEIFLACTACHTEKADALGPSLKGVVGRKAGSLQDFRYSAAMKRANLTWTEANLHDYLTDPQGKVKEAAAALDLAAITKRP